MTDKPEQNTGEQEQMAQAIFVALEARDALRQIPPQSVTGISQAELVRWLLNPQADDAQAAMEAAIRVDLNLYRSYRSLLTTLARRHIPRARAADDGERYQRAAEGVRISWRESRADAAQVYLMVELDPTAGFSDGEQLTLIVEPGEKPPAQRRQLEPLSGGGCQLILAADDPLLIALQEDDAEIYIV